ncbi:GNAT family N-acetyltransferase [Raoultella terrigena]|uniref:GNAT family N-acetyltransferase n=1 Tax=Raoultella terrigena TaxID=577 RepID=UPI0030E34C82
MNTYDIEPIKKDFPYDISAFDCGNEALNLFLSEHLQRQDEKQILRGYVYLAYGDGLPKALGFFTLSGGSFERSRFPSKSQQKKIPYINTPCIILGRLAVDRTVQRQGIGEMLVIEAAKIVLQSANAIGLHGMFVDAKNEAACKFYENLGFTRLLGDNGNLFFYPTSRIEQLP